MALRDFGAHPAVVPALLATVREDPDDLPRVHAADSLLAIVGVEPRSAAEHPALLEALASRGDGDSLEAARSRAEAVRALAALIHGCT